MSPARRAGLALVLVLFLVTACAQPPRHVVLPELRLGDPASYPTMEAHMRAPIVDGNHVDVLLNGDEIFPALLEAVRAARQSVTYLQYSWDESRIARDLVEAFAERCLRGIPVHVLIDGVGGLGMTDEHRATLTRAGCHLATFRPVGPFTVHRTNNRNHRRIVVMDGAIGFTGGSGVGPKWEGNGRTEGHWRDTDVRVSGPVVRQLQAAFAENWREATGIVLGGTAYFPPSLPRAGDMPAQVVASSPDYGASEMYITLLLAISAARRSIAITNPYFLPDERLLEALVAARRRGALVRVLLPGKIDHAIVRQASRAGFRPLFEAGVEIHEYQPALLHAKTMVIDGVWSTVGSTNFDNRSFALHQELNLVVHSAAVGARMEQIFADDLTRARRLSYEAWRRRPLRDRLIELLIRPAKDLL